MGLQPITSKWRYTSSMELQPTGETSRKVESQQSSPRGRKWWAKDVRTSSLYQCENIYELGGAVPARRRWVTAGSCESDVIAKRSFARSEMSNLFCFVFILIPLWYVSWAKSNYIDLRE